MRFTCLECGEWVDAWTGYKDGYGDFWCKKCSKVEKKGAQVPPSAKADGLHCEETYDTV